MKTKKNKTLILSKATIVSLDSKQQGEVKGGYWFTYFYQDCWSWHPVCPTMPLPDCGPY